MEKKLTNNLGLKVLSVCLAFFVWLAVMNISDPEVSGSKEVPLEVLNEEVLKSSGLTYELLSEKNSVTVTYKVRALDAGSVSASDFRAYIDLADMYEPTGAVPVKIEAKNNKVDSVSPRPAVVRVDTEELQSKRFNISVYLEGTAEDGYREGSVSVSPAYIYVNGPVSLVGQISTVGIVVSIDGANGDLTGTAGVQCFDANKNAITLDERVSLSRSEIDYTLPILKIKNLGLNFETEGKVAEGYRFTGIESETNSVAVVGLKSDLAGVNSITIPKSELNMDGADSDREVVIDLEKYLPEGVELADSVSQIRVVMKVEPLETKTIDLPASKIKQVGASSLYSYQYDRDTIRVVIKGLKEDLEQVDEDALGAELNVGDMTPGIHEGEITFQLGAAYELVSCDSLQIIVHDRDSVPSAAASGTGAHDEARKETSASEANSAE